MMSREALKRWYWMPTAVLALGVLSIAMLLWIDRINRAQRVNFDLCDALMDIQIKTASSHLWLEEAIFEKASVEIDRAFAELELAISLARAILSGGESEHGMPLEPVTDQGLREEFEGIHSLLTQLNTIALQRIQDPDNARIGSALDQRFDELYKEAQSQADALEVVIERKNILAMAQSERLFWSIFFAWALIVGGAATGLWSLEARRKAAEKALQKANEALQSRTEELRTHKEHLRELVTERTAELIAANRTLQQEIVERKQTEASLRASENKFRTLVENLPQKIFLKDKDSTYVYCNDNFVRDLGLRPDEILGKTDYDLLPSHVAEKEIAEDRRILQSGKTEEIEERHGTNGHEIVVQKFKVPIRNERECPGGILGIVWDITEKVRLESIAEATNTMENIGYVFSGIRHEIGNPINSIKMTLSLLTGKIETCPRETIREYINWIVSEVSRVEYLLKALKNFNMYETPELQNVHVKTFMERFLSLVSADFDVRGIKIDSLIHPDAEWAYTDSRALQQVMLNVMSNASDAMNGREAPEIVIEVLKRDGTIKIKVTDNGGGMTDEQQKELFKPFRTSKPAGTGLGLVIAKRMLTGMKGTIEIKSKQDKGTTVNISIPKGRGELILEQENTSCH